MNTPSTTNGKVGGSAAAIRTNGTNGVSLRNGDSQSERNHPEHSRQQHRQEHEKQVPLRYGSKDGLSTTSTADDGDDRSYKSFGSTHSQSHSKYSKKSGISSIGQGHPSTDDDKSETSSIGSTGGHTHHSHGTGESSAGGGFSGGGGGKGSVTQSERSRSGLNPRLLSHSSSIIGLDSMIENRREEGDLTVNVVHMEVPVSFRVLSLPSLPVCIGICFT
jgi:hypothetical protein